MFKNAKQHLAYTIRLFGFTRHLPPQVIELNKELSKKWSLKLFTLFIPLAFGTLLAQITMGLSDSLAISFACFVAIMSLAQICVVWISQNKPEGYMGLIALQLVVLVMKAMQ